MRSLESCLILCALAAVLSCTAKVNKFEPASYLDTKVSMPREVKELSDAPSRIIVMLDLASCASCELKSLKFWDDDLAQFCEMDPDNTFLDIIVVVNKERDDEIDSALSRLEAIYPIKVFMNKALRDKYIFCIFGK